MKKIFVVAVLILLQVSPTAKSRAADLPEYRLILSPYAGVHFFTSHRDFDNTGEVGLRLETFLTRPWSAEVGMGLLSTEDTNNRSHNSLTYTLNANYHLSVQDKKLDPFLIFGLGGDFLPGHRIGPEIGFGMRYFLHDDLALRADIRRFFLFENRADVVATFGLSYFRGTARATIPTPKKQTAPPAPSAPPVPPEPPPPPPVPEADSDHDGIPDSLDKCPNTMNGAKVNTDGCVVSITLNIQFDMGSNKILPESFPGIERFALFMGENTSLKVEIQGHTDNVGPADANLALSEARARAVRDLLIEKFAIAPERLSAKGYGQSHPLATNETPEGRAQNRRVEAVIK